jgi:hypothetical protein
MTSGPTFKLDAERKILETTPPLGNLMDGKDLSVLSMEHPSTTNKYVSTDKTLKYTKSSKKCMKSLRRNLYNNPYLPCSIEAQQCDQVRGILNGLPTICTISI